MSSPHPPPRPSTLEVTMTWGRAFLSFSGLDLWSRTICSWAIWSWTINNLEEYSKLNMMLQDHIGNAPCFRSIYGKHTPGASLCHRPRNLSQLVSEVAFGERLARSAFTLALLAHRAESSLWDYPGAVYTKIILLEHTWLEHYSRLFMVQDHVPGTIWSWSIMIGLWSWHIMVLDHKSRPKSPKSVLCPGNRK